MGWKDLFKSKPKKKQRSKSDVNQRTTDKRVRQDEERRRASAGPSSQGNRLDRPQEQVPKRRSASDASLGHDVTPDERYIPGNPKREAPKKDMRDLTLPKEETRRTERADDGRHQLVTSSETKHDARAAPHGTERVGKQHVTFSEADDTLGKSYSERREQDRLVEHMMNGLPIVPETIMGKGDSYSNKPNSKAVKYEESSSEHIQVAKVKDLQQRAVPAYITADEMTEQHYLYRMNHPRRGVALIFNIGEFLPVTGMKKRNGYEVDGELMKGTFSKLGFDVQYHANQTSIQVQRKINKVAEEFHGDADCFVCVIMTHGNRNMSDLVFTKDGCLGLDFIVERFNGEHCPTLAGKPKLFFVQACRGEKMDAGLDIPFIEDHDQTDASAKKSKIPVEADILLSQATTPGYLSFRNSGRGSIYIRCLTKALATYGFTEDILSILTRVNAMVAFEFESNSSSQPEYSGKKQMPAFTCQLTKRLVFSAPPKHLK